MGLSAKQVSALKRNIDHRNVRTREVDGRTLSYIEGSHAIAEANRIFGFDGWDRETVESRCVLARESRGTFLAVYIARVRIIIRADDTTIIREGHGTGEGRGTSPGEVHDIAHKTAETDATKRALATFGKPFGLALYGSGKADRRSHAPAAQAKPPVPGQRLGFHPDDTTPIPRPSRYYGHEQYPASRQQPISQQPQGGQPVRRAQRANGVPIAPDAPELLPAKIDKSALSIAEPRRLRDKAHLRFVTSQPCLVCGRQPSDPHHLRFAQPRAIGMKVSDEFTVPLCRGHHRQLHQASNEIAWWADLNIDAMEIAKRLWDESHGRSAALDQSNEIESTAKT